MKFSRQHPSPTYTRLIEQYRQMHDMGDKTRGLKPEQTFPGHSITPHVKNIRSLIKATQSKEILDYGSGKGEQYRNVKITDDETGKSSELLEYWGVNVSCYDPAYTPFTTPPTSVYDGVICTDVLEHCPEEDLEWIIEDLFSHAERFVYANIACYPAQARLPDGANAHCTVKPPQWWSSLFAKVAAKYPDILWRIKVLEKTEHPDGKVEYRASIYGNELETYGNVPLD